MTGPGDGGLQVTDEMKRVLDEKEKLAKSKVCTKCLHFQVCAIVKGVMPLIGGSFKEGEAPIDPDDLAKICKAHIPLGAIPQ